MGRGNPKIRECGTNGFDKDPKRAKEAQPKSVAARKANTDKQDFEVAIAQKILNGQTLTAEEEQKVAGYGIPNGAQWQVGMIAVLEEAKQGNYKAYELLMKIARFYVERTETKTEVDLPWNSKEELKQRLKELNG